MMKEIARKCWNRISYNRIIQTMLYSLFTHIYKYNIKDSSSTIDHLLQHKCSIARYGDGELDMIWGIGNGFQRYDPMLASRLQLIISTSIQGLIIGMPHTLVSCDEYDTNGRKFAMLFVAKNWRRIICTVPVRGGYFNTNFTRFYLSVSDKSKCSESISKIKKLWEGRHIIIVEGESTRFGVGNDLLNEALSIKRILCPPCDAFSSYDTILDASLHYATKGCLFILCLGMTATVLAYDLTLKGYQALDMGHLDVEYEWFKMGVKSKCALPHKAVNEAGVQVVNDLLRDTEYESSIVATIKG